MLETEYKFGEVHTLASQVNSASDKVQFKNIFENGNGGVSLLAFKKGQALAEHLAPSVAAKADSKVMLVKVKSEK